MKSARHIARNARTAITHPPILLKWLEYQLARRQGKDPQLFIVGSRFGGFPNFNALLGAWTYKPGAEELRFISESISGAQTIVDVGANFGIHSIAFCVRAPDAYVYSFEPNPRTHQALLGNIALNECAERIKAIRMAVGAQDGMVPFSDTDDPATNRIVDVAEPHVSVPATTLECFSKSEGLSSIDFLKVDVEGAEVDLLEGAASLFTSGSIRGGMIEICPGNLKLFNRSVSDIVQFFGDAGYELFWIDDRFPGRPNVRVEDVDEGFSANAGFCRGDE